MADAAASFLTDDIWMVVGHTPYWCWEEGRIVKKHFEMVGMGHGPEYGHRSRLHSWERTREMGTQVDSSSSFD